MFGELEDISIGTFYLSPMYSESNFSVDFFSTFNEEINLYKNTGIGIAQGDLNARTVSETDFIKYDKFEDTSGIGDSKNYDNQYLRNAEDTKTNLRGK